MRKGGEGRAHMDESITYVVKRMKCFWLSAPTQLFTQGQW